MNNKVSSIFLFTLLIGLSSASQATNNDKREQSYVLPTEKRLHSDSAKLNIHAPLSTRLYVSNGGNDRFLDIGAPATLGLLWLGFMGLRLKRNKS